MEIRYIFRLFIKWLWLIILVPAIAGFGAYYVSVYQTIPIYNARATLCIVRSSVDPETRVTAVYGDISSAQNAVRNYGDIIKSRSAINEALDKLNIREYTAERFINHISLVFPVRESFVVAVSVYDEDPRLASDMANVLSEILVDRTNKFMTMSVIKTLDAAEVPTYPSNDERTKNVSIAIMAGFIFCMVLIFIAEYIGSEVIKEEKDIVKYLKLPVLAAVPDMKVIKDMK